MQACAHGLIKEPEPAKRRSLSWLTETLSGADVLLYAGLVSLAILLPLEERHCLFLMSVK